MKNLLSSLCSCVIPKTEKLTVKIEYTDNCINEPKFIQCKTNTKYSDKHLSTSISPINNININNKYNNSSISNSKFDNQFNNTINFTNLSNISNSGQMSPCNVSSINSLNTQKYKKNISRYKISKRLINENDIFNRFQDNVDNIINEIKQKKTISESDDSEMCFSK